MRSQAAHHRQRNHRRQPQNGGVVAQKPGADAQVSRHGRVEDARAGESERQRDEAGQHQRRHREVPEEDPLSARHRRIPALSSRAANSRVRALAPMRIVSAQHRHKRPPRRRRPALCQIALAHSGFHSGPRKSRPSAARMRHACVLCSKAARGIANEIILYGFRPMVKVARSAPAESGRIRITSTCQSAFQQERPLTTTTARW